MHYELRNEGDSGVLLYKAFDVFTSEGDSGSLIITEKNKQVYIAGHHAGKKETDAYGCAVTTNVLIDTKIPKTKLAIERRNESEEDVLKYSAPVERLRQ